MKSDRFPMGEPILLTSEMLDPENACPWKGTDFKVPYAGLILARIEAPRKMPKNLPPFLPFRTSAGNLLFPLCACCAEKKSLQPCSHLSEERSFIGAYTDEDIQLALKFGYVVWEVFEVEKNAIFKFLFSRFGIGLKKHGVLVPFLTILMLF